MIPVQSNRPPATTKSNRLQLTSSVNCIAIKGMNNRSATVSTMPMSLLPCIVIYVLFYNYKVLNIRLVALHVKLSKRTLYFKVLTRNEVIKVYEFCMRRLHYGL